MSGIKNFIDVRENFVAEIEKIIMIDRLLSFFRAEV